MSSMPSGTWTSSGQMQPAPSPAERQARMKKIVTMVVGGIVTLVLLFVVAIVGVVLWVMRQSDVNRLAMEKVRQNPAVVERLGTPIEMGWMISGSISTAGDSGSAEVTIPIHGPKGGADMYVSARKAMGNWSFTDLTVKTSSGESIRVAGDPGREPAEPAKPETTTF